MKEYNEIVYGNGFLKIKDILVNTRQLKAMSFSEGVIPNLTMWLEGDSVLEFDVTKDQWETIRLWLLEG